MKALVFCVLFLSACLGNGTKDINTVVPNPEAGCFAKAGTYKSLASIRKHDCSTEPPRTILGNIETVDNRELACGHFRVEGAFINRPSVLVIRVSDKKIVGSLTVFFQGCRANYRIAFTLM